MKILISIISAGLSFLFFISPSIGFADDLVVTGSVEGMQTFDSPEGIIFQTAVVQPGAEVAALSTFEVRFLAGTHILSGAHLSVQLRDADGLSNRCEMTYFGDLAVTNDPEDDFDGDGISNHEECNSGINPNNPDSDTDGMPDGWEIHYGFNPLIDDSYEDTDNDGLTNLQEYNLGLNPMDGVADSDNDQLPDWWEVQYFEYGLANSAGDDNDGDGLTNLQEYNLGLDPMDGVVDSDGDQLPDWWEVQNFGFNLGYNENSDPDNDGLTNIQEYQYGTCAQDPDSDDDLMPDNWEIQYGLNPLTDDSYNDLDNDGLTNIQEFNLGLNPADGVADSDYDQLPDWWEVQYFGLDLSFTSSSDPDNDGLTNGQEFQYGTNPQISDSDGDLMPDYWEVQNELNPLTDDSGADPDNDGLTNLEEYQVGKDPQTPDNILSETLPIDTTEQNLPWTDIVSASEIVYGGGNNNQHIIVTVDFSKIHKVNLAANDPFWFKYLRSFWDNNGIFIPNRRDETFSSTHTAFDNCSDPLGETEEWWNFGRWIRFNEDNTQITRNYTNSYHPYYWEGPFYDSRDCVYQLYNDNLTVRNKFLAHHIMRAIPSEQGTMFPGESGLGPNYFPGDGPAVHYRFKWILNDKVILADDGYNYAEAYYWRDVRAGEVTEDGWAIVPESPEMERWIFVRPKSSSKGYSFGPCAVTEIDLQDGGDAIICSPQLWGDIPSNREMEVFLDGGGALGEEFFVGIGAADRITSADFDKEGFYLIVKQPDGSYELSQRISTQEAWEQLKLTGSLTINGSGNDFENGIKRGMQMASEMDLNVSVHYYMPQIASKDHYHSIGNKAMREALAYIFEQSNVYQKTINVQTHSWSGFVVTTSCGNSCSFINHISYAPAAIDTYVLQDCYNSWMGQSHVIWSSGDLLSHITYNLTLRFSNSNGIHTIELETGHSLDQILPARDWSALWAYSHSYYNEGK